MSESGTYVPSLGRPLSVVEQRVLDAARNEDLVFQQVYNRPETLRWWSDETEYRTLTRAERAAVYRLEDAGLLARYRNPSCFTRGLFEVARGACSVVSQADGSGRYGTHEEGR